MSDNVNHPKHYTWLKDKCGIEVLDITRHLDFDLGNAIKYILRAGHKKDAGKSQHEKTVEDLRKAIFYLNDEIKLLDGNSIEKERPQGVVIVPISIAIKGLSHAIYYSVDSNNLSIGQFFEQSSKVNFIIEIVKELDWHKFALHLITHAYDLDVAREASIFPIYLRGEVEFYPSNPPGPNFMEITLVIYELEVDSCVIGIDAQSSIKVKNDMNLASSKEDLKEYLDETFIDKIHRCEIIKPFNKKE